MKNLKLLTSAIFALMLCLGFSSCGDDDNSLKDPYNTVTSAKTEFVFTVNENFAKYFTIWATHLDDKGQTITDVLKTDEIRIGSTFLSFPANVTINIIFSRNSEPAPAATSFEQLTFSYTVEETARYIIYGEERVSNSSSNFSNTIQPVNFDNWTQIITNNPKSFSISISKDGVVEFK